MGVRMNKTVVELKRIKISKLSILNVMQSNLDKIDKCRSEILALNEMVHKLEVKNVELSLDVEKHNEKAFELFDKL